MQLLNRDPLQRLTVAEAKHHPFFNKVYASLFLSLTLEIELLFRDWSSLRTSSGVLPFTPKPASVSFGHSEEITLSMGSPYGGDLGPDPYPRFTFSSPSFLVERFAVSLAPPARATVPAAPPRPLCPLPQPHTVRAPRALGILPAAGSIRKLFARDDGKGIPHTKGTPGKENSREWLLPHEHVEKERARAPPPNIAERRRTGKPEVHHEDGLNSIGEWRVRNRKAILVESRAPPTLGIDGERRTRTRRDVRSVFGVSNR